VSAAPTLLYHQGHLLGPMRTARISAEELRQVVRSEGHAQLSDITAIVLESDGTFSILTADPRPLSG